jgi:hypothetical protein
MDKLKTLAILDDNNVVINISSYNYVENVVECSIETGIDNKDNYQKILLTSNEPFIGDIYDPTLNRFIGPQPYPSWTLDDKGIWQPPIPCPEEEVGVTFYLWDEAGYQQDPTTGWQLNYIVVSPQPLEEII